MLASLVACSSPRPPPQLVHLRSAAPTENPPVRLGTASAAANWQLLLPVTVPDYLDRDAVLVPQGQASLQPVPGVRWAEPLREAVPRLLRDDLSTLLGAGRMWIAPVPAGIAIQRQVRVDLLAFEATEDQRQVVLRARWTVSDAGASPRAELSVVQVPVSSGGVDGLIAAHRMALWLLAQQVAGR